MSPERAKRKMAKFANSKTALKIRPQLERRFLAMQVNITSAQENIASALNATRMNRVFAGQTLLELKDGFEHGEWLPYMTKLCAQAKVPTRTARDYMHDAEIASKIPTAWLDEAERQGFNPATRDVRDKLVEWQIENPDDKSAPAVVVKYVLGIFVSAADKAKHAAARAVDTEFAKKCIADQQAAREQEKAKKAEAAAQLIKQEARAEEIIHAGYRALSTKYHPDKQGGSDEQFKLLTAARDLLCARLRQKEFSYLSFGGVRS